MKSVDIAATAAPGIPMTAADPSGSNQQTVSVNRQTRTPESPVTPRKSPTAPDVTARSDLQGDPSAVGKNADLALTRSRRDPLQAVDASSVSERQEGPYLVTVRAAKRPAVSAKADGVCGCGGTIRKTAPITNVCDSCASRATKPFVSRRAYVSLDEAVTAVVSKLYTFYEGIDDDLWFARAVRSLESPDGGKVGPLPDRTVIEVEKRDPQTLFYEIHPDIKQTFWRRRYARLGDLCATFNASQENGGAR